MDQDGRLFLGMHQHCRPSQKCPPLKPRQVLLDAAADEKVSWGSYHAVTDMIPSLAVRYPYMCYGFLANLELQKVRPRTKARI